MLTPLDIQKKEFRRALRGYNEDEVDNFLALVAQDFENLLRENVDLKDKIVQIEQKVARYQEIEETIKNTMVMAQKNTDELKQNAEKEANNILDRSRIEADQLVREAEQEAAGIIAGAEKQLSEVTSEYNRMQRDTRIFRLRFRSLLESQIKILDSEEKELPARDELEEEVS